MPSLDYVSDLQENDKNDSLLKCSFFALFREHTHANGVCLPGAGLGAGGWGAEHAGRRGPTEARPGNAWTGNLLKAALSATAQCTVPHVYSHTITLAAPPR